MFRPMRILNGHICGLKPKGFKPQIAYLISRKGTRPALIYNKRGSNGNNCLGCISVALLYCSHALLHNSCAPANPFHCGDIYDVCSN